MFEGKSALYEPKVSALSAPYASLPLPGARNSGLRGVGVRACRHPKGAARSRSCSVANTLTCATKQHGLLGFDQAFDAREQSLIKKMGLVRRVASTRPQFQPDAPAFIAQIGGNRCVAIKTFVGARHVFFLRAAVVHGEGVYVTAHVAFVGCDRRPCYCSHTAIKHVALPHQRIQ